MRFERPIDDWLLTCACGDDLAVQATALLAKLEELHRKGPPLRDGSTIQFGWSRLRLLATAEGLLVAEPDFDRDAESGVFPEVDRSLRVQAQQAAICAAVGAAGDDVRFDQTLVIEKDCLTKPILYLSRAVTQHREFSGWFVGTSPGIQSHAAPEALEIILVYHLLALRSPLLSVLQLPTGYLAMFNGAELATAFDPDGVRVYVSE